MIYFDIDGVRFMWPNSRYSLIKVWYLFFKLIYHYLVIFPNFEIFSNTFQMIYLTDSQMSWKEIKQHTLPHTYYIIKSILGFYEMFFIGYVLLLCELHSSSSQNQWSCWCRSLSSCTTVKKKELFSLVEKWETHPMTIYPNTEEISLGWSSQSVINDSV